MKRKKGKESKIVENQMILKFFTWGKSEKIKVGENKTIYLKNDLNILN